SSNPEESRNACREISSCISFGETTYGSSGCMIHLTPDALPASFRRCSQRSCRYQRPVEWMSDCPNIRCMWQLGSILQAAADLVKKLLPALAQHEPSDPS